MKYTHKRVKKRGSIYEKAARIHAAGFGDVCHAAAGRAGGHGLRGGGNCTKNSCGNTGQGEIIGISYYI